MDKEPRIKQNADMDSDAIYTTNQPQIVEHAKYCYLNYPTIVNNIGQEKRKYRNNWKSYSKVDNTLAASQRAIGESSNLAQLALTYSYNFPTQKYQNIACILSVVAQISIDSAKRSFDIDIVSEIKRLKKELNVKINKYPQFWLSIRPDTKKENINKELICPMNYLHNIKFDTVYPKRNETIPMDYFFKPFPVNAERVRARRLEQVIENYISELKYGYVNEIDEHLLLKQNFDDMIRALQQIYISTNQVGIMSWLLNRGFLITVMARGHKDYMLSKLNQNKVILLKTLYNVNKTAFLMCWSNNIETN